MYQYTKIILSKVSFDDALFKKQLAKAESRLTEEEMKQIKIDFKL